MIPQLITNLTQAQVCIGNHDKNFISMSAERNGRFMSATENTIATEDIKNVKCNDQLISKNHLPCELQNSHSQYTMFLFKLMIHCR